MQLRLLDVYVRLLDDYLMYMNNIWFPEGHGMQPQNLEAGLSLDDEHAVEVRFVVKFKNAEEVQVRKRKSCTTRVVCCLKNEFSKHSIQKTLYREHILESKGWVAYLVLSSIKGLGRSALKELALGAPFEHAACVDLHWAHNVACILTLRPSPPFLISCRHTGSAQGVKAHLGIMTACFASC